MKIVFALIVSTVICFGGLVLARAQTKPLLFEKFERIANGDAKARMDNFLQELNDNPGAMAYIIVYSGKTEYQSYLNLKTNKYDVECVLPQKGEVLRRINLYKTHLIKTRGFKDQTTTEFWMVLGKEELPKPVPTVKAKDVKFRKGYIAKKRDRLKDCRVVKDANGK